MRVVWAAITANTAVDERASKECLRHQGYASAIQNASNPACSLALAMATVSCTGSMLSCRTPILNGMVMKVDSYSVRQLPAQPPVFEIQFSVIRASVGILPRMLKAFDQLPHRFVQRGRNSGLLSPLHNRAVHEIHFGL